MCIPNLQLFEVCATRKKSLKRYYWEKPLAHLSSLRFSFKSLSERINSDIQRLSLPMHGTGTEKGEKQKQFLKIFPPRHLGSTEAEMFVFFVYEKEWNVYLPILLVTSAMFHDISSAYRTTVNFPAMLLLNIGHEMWVEVTWYF